MTEVFFPPGTDSNRESNDSIQKRPGDRPFSIPHTTIAAYQKEKSIDQDRNLQQIVFDEAITIACDWFEATNGEAITEEAIQNLYDAGYVSSTPAEILAMFYDWHDYQSVAQSYLDEREDPEVSKKALVASLRQEADMGLVPAIFFKKSVPYKIDNPNGKRKLSRYQFIDEEASDDVVLQRYHKYLVADYVTKDRAPGDEVTEDRKINIALGFTQESEKALSSFYGSLKNSNGSLTDEQIALVIEELDAYEYIYPDSRKKHLKTLAAAGQHIPKKLEKAEYYYDLEHKKIILLGRTALLQIAFDEGKQYAEFLAKQNKLLIGNQATQAYKTASETGQISPLAKILTTPSAEFEKMKRDNYQYTELDKDAYISYGKWILSILSDSQDPLVISVIRTASRLDIGPGEKAVIAKFDSITSYFEQLGFANTSKRGRFAAWSFEDHVENIQRIAQEIGGRPTPKILNERVRQGFAEPSVYVIKVSHGFSKVMEAAGFPAYHQPVSRDELILRGLDFHDKNGRFPTKKDFVTGSTMGGYFPLYKAFNSTAEYHQVLAEQLDGDIEEDLAA